jgi:cytosolic carboxypeptidase protein 6
MQHFYRPFILVILAFALTNCATVRQTSQTESSSANSRENATKTRVILKENAMRLSTDATRAFSYDPPGSLITTDKPIETQTKQIFAFEQAGIYFSNRHDGARLNNVQMINDSVFIGVISPENAPVNFSPWYGFTAWSKKAKNISFTLTYRDGGQRYTPKLSAKPSTDATSWKKIDSTAFTLYFDSTGRRVTSATMRLALTQDTLWVSAQELFTSRDFEVWSSRLAQQNQGFVRKSVLGASSLGKPIIRLDISEAPANAPCVVIVSRQHPPEHTGTLALLPFAETLCANTALAKEFRQKYRVFIVPCMNPDGVDAGHWRHNAHGIDLNRDWYNFNQPETRLVRDALVKMRDSLKITFAFGIDFHTTQHDVFYTLSNPSGLAAQDSANTELMQLFTPEAAKRSAMVQTWLERTQKLFPNYQVMIDDSPRTPTGATSARWFDRVLLAPAVTYEAGDDTDRELIRQIGIGSANVLMEMLLKE